VSEAGVVVLAFVVGGGWGCGGRLVVGFVGLCGGVFVDGEYGEGPLGFLVQWGGGVVVVVLGVGGCVGGLEFVGIASDLDLAVSVLIEFVQGEMPVLGGFLSEGGGLFMGCNSVGWVGGIGCGVAVGNEEFFEE